MVKNNWKSAVTQRLGMALGEVGSISLFGRAPEAHRLFAEHLMAEKPTRLTALTTGRTVAEWGPRGPLGADNHWLDGLVGCAVAASMEGATIPGAAPTKPKPRKSYRERYEEYRRGRGA